MTDPKPFRTILQLGKARVVDRGPNYFKMAIGGSTTITVDCHMAMFDIRDGDLLTLYTEVLMAKPQGAS